MSRQEEIATLTAENERLHAQNAELLSLLATVYADCTLPEPLNGRIRTMLTSNTARDYEALPGGGFSRSTMRRRNGSARPPAARALS